MNKKKLYEEIRDNLKHREKEKLLKELRNHLKLKKEVVRREGDKTIVDFTQIPENVLNFWGEYHQDPESGKWEIFYEVEENDV